MARQALFWGPIMAKYCRYWPSLYSSRYDEVKVCKSGYCTFSNTFCSIPNRWTVSGNGSVFWIHPPARKGEEIKAKILHSREIWAYSNQCVCCNSSFPKVALPSGSSEGNFMWVQVPSSAPGRSRCKDGADFLYIVLVIRWWRSGDADEGKRTFQPISFDE